MSAKELFDRFSDALMSDERILSASERELLANLLRQVRTQAETEHNQVFEVIARAVGETVAQRAFAVMGKSVTRRILESPVASDAVFAMPPKPPAPGPPSPGQAPPAPPSTGIREIWAMPPKPPAPGPPSPATPPAPPPAPPSTGIAGTCALAEGHEVGLLNRPAVLPAQCVVLDEFMVPADLEALTQYALGREADFQLSEVISPGVTGGLVDFQHRRSRVLYDLGKTGTALVERIRACLPRILPKLNHDPFPIGRIESQITASNHGDYFRWHCDDSQPEIATREITFVYFFHREPCEFSGGELRLYESRWNDGSYAPTDTYRTIVPQPNQLVLFDSSLAHEITPVECPSGKFASSRFTVNGWFHR